MFALRKLALGGALLFAPLQLFDRLGAPLTLMLLDFADRSNGGSKPATIAKQGVAAMSSRQQLGLRGRRCRWSAAGGDVQYRWRECSGTAMSKFFGANAEGKYPLRAVRSSSSKGWSAAHNSVGPEALSEPAQAGPRWTHDDQRFAGFADGAALRRQDPPAAANQLQALRIAVVNLGPREARREPSRRCRCCSRSLLPCLPFGLSIELASTGIGAEPPRLPVALPVQALLGVGGYGHAAYRVDGHG
jgi:hypothetical protein